MRILFVAPQPFFRDRGTPIRVLHQLEVLSRMGHQVDVACYPFGEDISLPGVRIRRCPRWPGIRDAPVGPSPVKFPLDFLLFWHVLFLCLRGRYNVIQAVEEAAFFSVWLKKVFRCRLVYNMDSYVSDQLRYTGFVKFRPLLKLAEAFERSAMRNADYVATVGPVLSDVVRRFAPATRVLQLEDAPLDEEFVEDIEGARRLRLELGLGDLPAVVYTGNFGNYQGVDLLVRTAGVLAGKRPDVRIVLAGGDPREIERMKELAGNVGADRVCVFAGKRPTDEMRAFMTLAAVLISPRTQGTNPPLKLYPYMQSGRPLVATRLPTHTQVLDDSCAILRLPTPVDLADGILTVLGNRDLAASITGEARARVASRYSLGVFREKVRSAYETLAASMAG